MNKFIIFFIQIVIFVFAFSFVPVTGQVQEGMVKYTPDFRFKDGIYINFDQVKMNEPIPKAKLLTSMDYNDREFFKNILSAEKLYYYDGMGVRQEIAVNTIWGYSRNGVLYIQVQEDFTRVTFIGNICHFVADITTIDSRSYGYPYGGYYDPYYYSPYSYRSYYPYGSYYSPYSNYNMARTEIKQYLIDFETGKVIEFDVESTELLIMKDAELYEEFVKLPKSEKKKLMFVYIRKYNERNPLYIPENK